MPLSKDEAQSKIARMIRRWTWALTVPPAVAGPKLIRWAKVWNVKREATPSTLYEEAEKEQTKIRSQQWEKLNAKNDARHLQAEKRHAEQAARSADDRETGIVTSLLKEILLKTTDRVVLEIVHDALDLEPPEMEEEKEESKVDQQVNKKLKRKKSSYKSKQRKKLGDIINKSTILSNDDKRVASEYVGSVKNQQDRGLFLCALLTNASPNARVRLIESALAASKANKQIVFDKQSRAQYRQVISNCNKLRDVNRKTALKAIDSIDSHELSGAILEALLEGASPYTMLALANVGTSSATSPSSSPNAGENNRKKILTGETKTNGGVAAAKIVDFGDANEPVSQKMKDAIKAALANRKASTISYGQHCAAVYALKLLKTNIHASQLILNIIMDEDGSIIRSSCFSKADVNVWKDKEKKSFLNFLQNQCALTARQLPAAVRAVSKSKLKTAVQILLMQSVLKAVCNGATTKGKGKNSNASQSTAKADPSAKCTTADRDAAIYAVQANTKITRDQKHAFKLAVKKSMTMADLFILIHEILNNGTPENLINCLSNATTDSRKIEISKKMANQVLKSTELILNKASKEMAIATVLKDECKTSKLLVAVCEAAISGKLPKQISEALSSITDGDKVALLTMLNSCKQNKDPNSVDAVKTAKTAAMKATSYGEQALILTMVLRGDDARTLKKAANRAAVDGTRQQIHVSEEQKVMVQSLVDTLVDDPNSKISADHSNVCDDALPDISEGSQLVKLLGALLLTVNASIIRKMAEAWAPKDEFGRSIKKNSLDGLNKKQKSKGILIIQNISWLAASDKEVALEIADICKHQMTLLLLFIAILDGKPARVLKKLKSDIRNMDPSVVPVDDRMEYKLINGTATKESQMTADLLTVIERAKNGPTGAKRSGAMRAVAKSDRASITLAIIAALINNQSVYQIVGARALGVDAQIDDRTKQAMKEEDEKEQNAADAEKEKKFGLILHSTVHSDNQKAAGLVALEKARSSPMRCEVLLALLTHQTPEKILNSVNKRGISRGLHGQEQKDVLKQVQSSTLWDEHKALTAKLVSNATTKQELVIILEKAVGWLEHVTQDDKNKFNVAVDKCKNFAKIESEANGKKLYLLQWLEKIQTKMQLYVLQLVALDWQNEALHWTGVAYEKIFTDKLPEPLIPSTIELTKECIKKAKNPKPQKKAARQMISKAQEQQHIIEILNHVIAGSKPKLIRNSYDAPPDGWVRVSRDDLIQKYSLSAAERNKKKTKVTKKEEVVKVVIDTRVLDEEVDLLDQTLDFDETLTRRQKFAIRKCLVPEICNSMEKFDSINRLQKLLSVAHRAEDKLAKRDVPSECYKQTCAQVMQFDPKANDMIKNGAEEMLICNVNTVLRLAEVVRSTTMENYSPKATTMTFQWSKPGVSTTKIDSEDMRNIVAYIRSVQGLLQEERLAAKDAVERACVIRSEVEEIITIVEADISNGEGISNKRQYVVAARQIEQRRKDLQLRNQPTKSEIKQKKQHLENIKLNQDKKLKLKKEKNDAQQQIVLDIFKNVADHITPTLGHRQRVVAQRAILTSTSAHDRCKIMEGILLSATAQELKTCMTTADTINEERLSDILLNSSLPTELWQKSMEKISMLIPMNKRENENNNNDPDSNDGNEDNQETRETFDKYDDNNSYYKEIESILQNVLIHLDGHHVEKNKKIESDNAIPELVNEEHRATMIEIFHSMHTFTIDRKKCLEEALETLATYSQLCNVLLAVISDLSNESITMASNAQHNSNTLSKNALPHIKELMRNSHMMEYTSGPKHQSIINQIMISKSHYDLSIALFDAVEEHATIMKGMSGGGGGSSGGGGSGRNSGRGRGGSGEGRTAGRTNIHEHGLGYSQNHGHIAQKKRKEKEAWNEMQNQDSDEDEEPYRVSMKTMNGSRKPVKPESDIKKDLFKDSPRGKKIRGR